MKWGIKHKDALQIKLSKDWNKDENKIWIGNFEFPNIF